MRGRRGEKGKRRAALPAFPRVPPPRGFSRLPLYLRARSGSSPGPAGWDGGGGKMEDRQRTRRPPDVRRCGAEGGIPAVPFPVRGAQRGGGRAAGPGAASRERCGGAGGPGALRAVPALGFRERLRSGSAVSRRPTFISFEKSNEMKKNKKIPSFSFSSPPRLALVKRHSFYYYYFCFGTRSHSFPFPRARPPEVAAPGRSLPAGPSALAPSPPAGSPGAAAVRGAPALRPGRRPRVGIARRLTAAPLPARCAAQRRRGRCCALRSAPCALLSAPEARPGARRRPERAREGDGT